MKELMRISDDEKWQAVVSCAKDYDGKFLYGVKTTGIFCRPSCKSKTPVRTNVIFFDNPEDAKTMGFRPCKRCCPDKPIFQPDLELVEKAKALFIEEYDKEIDMNKISKQLGISRNHFIRLFKLHFGLTPTQYITKIRVEKAAGLLKEQDINILDIAHMSGFNSLSNFYKCFKQHTGYTPSEYGKIK